MADKEEENDCQPPLFVGAVITEVQIQNDECYVTLPVQGHLMQTKSGHWFASEHYATKGTLED